RDLRPSLKTPQNEVRALHQGVYDRCSNDVTSSKSRRRMNGRLRKSLDITGSMTERTRIPQVGFSGRQPNLVVAGFLLRLVEDLDSWNRYPWGSYLWALTHPQLKTALPRRQHHVGVKADRIAKYTLTGFVFAFKDGRQPLTVTSTEVERQTDWWSDSQRFFNSIADDFQPPTKRGRSYSPPRPPRPPAPPISSFAGVGASSPEAAITVPKSLEQRVAALEQAVHDLQAGQRSLEAGQSDLEAGYRAMQAAYSGMNYTHARVETSRDVALGRWQHDAMSLVLIAIDIPEQHWPT
ncbi:hypothetical protein Ccrd_003486, partial [Cynara cardunculus var. scolymus]